MPAGEGGPGQAVSCLQGSASGRERLAYTLTYDTRNPSKHTPLYEIGGNSDLLSFIASSGLDEVNIETDTFKLAVKRSGAPVMYPAAPAPAPMAAPAQMAAPAAAPAAAPVAPAAPAANTVTQKSPMIGTFYTASSPDTPAFVQVGDMVKPGQILCIIEAMKLFNEIESDFAGKIVQVLVNDKTPVEYDQPLFIIEPA